MKEIMAAKKRVYRQRSSRMGKTPNWLQMPDEIMGGMILQRLDAVEILMNVQKVCRDWRRICKDPAMWKVIDMHRCFDNNYYIVKLTKQAVHRSRGELIDISLDDFGTDLLLNFISRWYFYKILNSVVFCVALNANLVHSSSKLKSLCLTRCYSITGNGLVRALKRLPCLETLELFYISIDPENIKVIGQSCPQLKTFKIKTPFMCDGDAFAIANSMPALRHLQLLDSIITNDGLQAILHGCPHLESLDLSGCSYLELDGSLEKLCRERIKDFKFTRPSYSLERCICGAGGCSAHQDYELSVISPEGDFEYDWL
ncbi:hypothetical protein OSB04_002003 [Centaurea solstitialis]|uniref:F-box domain-containing protein n=1 Tax=Centaurea solstitialis TaxID=347529 RepID=A0AA38UA46_9ASTR|nr:hypothetical protein OSB04_002003 [Centaurea solstitialis]